MSFENELAESHAAESCVGVAHPKAIEGMILFNEGKFFEAHEELETAWREEMGVIRDLYRGILQISVTYLHITRGNYEGAVKVYGRSQKWLNGWGEVCRGIKIGEFQSNAEQVMQEVQRLGKENLGKFNRVLFKPIEWSASKIWICDRCGSEMLEKNCKVTCPNCGNRFDCSDLNLYFD